jgi:CRISPR-associated protein Cas4
MKISVSLLSTYLYCPRKMFLQQVLKLKEPQKQSTVLGSLRHTFYDAVNRSEELLVKSITGGMGFQDVFGMYKKSYSKILRDRIIEFRPNIREVNLEIVDVFKKAWPNIELDAQDRASNVYKFIVENKVFGEKLWETLTPKIMTETRIDSNSLQLKGIVDRIEDHRTGYIPVELKTGKMPKEGVWPGHRIQIVAYAMLIEDKYGVTVKEGHVRYLDSKIERQIMINPFMREEIKDLIVEVKGVIERDFPPIFCESKKKCLNCGIRETCYDVGKVATLLSEMR